MDQRVPDDPVPPRRVWCSGAQQNAQKEIHNAASSAESARQQVWNENNRSYNTDWAQSWGEDNRSHVTDWAQSWGDYEHGGGRASNSAAVALTPANHHGPSQQRRWNSSSVQETQANFQAAANANREDEQESGGVRDIGMGYEDFHGPGWINEPTLRSKLAGILPAYRRKPHQAKWQFKNESTRVGTDSFEPANTQTSCGGDVLAEDRPQNFQPEKRTVNSWAQLFDETSGGTCSGNEGINQPQRAGPPDGPVGGQHGSANAKADRVVTHVCRSRIPRACKYMGKCRDIENCSYCHDSFHDNNRTKVKNLDTSKAGDLGRNEKVPLPSNAAGKTRRPDELLIEGHVCRSRIPRPCKFFQRCRDPNNCDYCHDFQAHSGKKTAKAWLRELHTDGNTSGSDLAIVPVVKDQSTSDRREVSAGDVKNRRDGNNDPSRAGDTIGIIRQRNANIRHGSKPERGHKAVAVRPNVDSKLLEDRPPEEYVGKFFPQMIDTEADDFKRAGKYANRGTDQQEREGNDDANDSEGGEGNDQGNGKKTGTNSGRREPQSRGRGSMEHRRVTFVDPNSVGIAE